MTNNVPWQIDVQIHNGRLDDFISLMRDTLDRHDPSKGSATAYVWSVSETQTTGRISQIWHSAPAAHVCMSLDGPSARDHLAAIGPDFENRLLEVAQPVNLVAYGEPMADMDDDRPASIQATTWIKSLINRGLATTGNRATTPKKKARLELVEG